MFEIAGGILIALAVIFIGLAPLGATVGLTDTKTELAASTLPAPN